MAHDDPRDPHHHHHVRGDAIPPDDLIAPTTRRAPVASATEGASTATPRATGVPTDEPAARDAPGRPGAAPRATLPEGAGRGRVLHLDCFSGIAGDMLVAALLDLGVPREPIQAALEALPLTDYRIGAAEVTVHSIAATRFVVQVEGPQPYRTYRVIRALLDDAPLPEAVRARAQSAFRALAVAEGRIHRIPPEDVHFHEVGAVDAMVDVVAASAALEWLGAVVACAPLPMGRGFTESAHGVIPLPAPAVVELLAGIPTEGVALPFELVTPTGAALVRANATQFVRWPAMRPVATGFGAGTRVLPDRPNLLRVILGDPGEGPDGHPALSLRDGYVTLEANLDDASGELLAHVTDALLRAGALDAWTAPIGMKKSRPGVLLCALARVADADRLARLVLAESTSLGVRLRGCSRLERPRRVVEVTTSYGPVPVKVADGDGLPPAVKPEDDAVRRLALAHAVPARTVHAAALTAFWDGPGRALR